MRRACQQLSTAGGFVSRRDVLVEPWRCRLAAAVQAGSVAADSGDASLQHTRLAEETSARNMWTALWGACTPVPLTWQPGHAPSSG